MVFRDRDHAGTLLSAKLAAYRRAPNAVVLGIPHGGLAVAAAVARELELPLDAFLSCKLLASADPGVTLGALSETGDAWINPEVPGTLRCACDVAGELGRARLELAWRRSLYRGGRGLPSVRDKRVLLVDDGVVTGATMTAALRGLRGLGPARLVAAVPVGALSSLAALRPSADELIALESPAEFERLALYYEDFRPEPVPRLLSRLRWRRGAGGPARAAVSP